MTDPVAAGSVRIGTYALEVGALTESYAAFEPEREDRNVNALRDALAEEAGEVRTPVVALETLQANTETVTKKCERAHELSRAAAEGRLLETDAVMAEVDSLLRLAERLDRDARFDEELRLLRALHGLLVLARRWLDLIRALRRALSAAQEAGDLAAQAWVRHELGSLHLCAMEPEAAAEQLRQALRLQQRLGQATGTCATRHNLDSAKRDRATRAAIKPWSRRLLRVAGVAAIISLLAVGGRGIALALDGDDDAASPTSTTGPATSDSPTTDTSTGTSATDTATTSTTGTSMPVDVTEPVVALVTPTEGSVVSTGTPEFSGTAGVEPGDAVEVLVEIVDENGGELAGSPLRARVAGGVWTVTPTFQLSDGSYQATATQSDGQGNTGSSAPVTFTVDTAAPALTLVCPESTASLTFTCTLTSTDAGTARFELTFVHSVSGTEEADDPDTTVELEPDTQLPFELTLPEPPDREGESDGFDVVAVQADAAGNIGRSDPARTFYSPVE